MTGVELYDKVVSQNGGSLLGRRVLSGRPSSLKNLPGIKHWGGIVRVCRKRYFVDIRWADGTLSRNQYLGDYSVMPGEDFMEPEHRQAAIDRGYMKAIVEKTQLSQTLTAEDILNG